MGIKFSLNFKQMISISYQIVNFVRSLFFSSSYISFFIFYFGFWKSNNQTAYIIIIIHGNLYDNQFPFLPPSSRHSHFSPPLHLCLPIFLLVYCFLIIVAILKTACLQKRKRKKKRKDYESRTMNYLHSSWKKPMGHWLHSIFLCNNCLVTWHKYANLKPYINY